MKSHATKSQIRNAAALLGSKGGKKGVPNPKKARSSEKARAAAQVRWARDREKRAALGESAAVADPAPAE